MKTARRLADRKKLLSVLMIFLSVALIITSLVIARRLSDSRNINPDKTDAAGEIINWSKVADITNGHSLGIVGGQLVGLATDPNLDLPDDPSTQRCRSTASRMNTFNGTTWSGIKNIGNIGCLGDFIDFNGKIAASQGPLSGIMLIDLNGTYYPPDPNAPAQGNPNASFVNEWGQSIFRTSSLIGVHDYGQDGVNNNTPAGNKVLFVNRILSGDSGDGREWDAISFFPQRSNVPQVMNYRNTPDEFGPGILVGDDLWIGANTFANGGGIHRYKYKPYPALREFKDLGDYPWMQGGAIGGIPDAYVTSMYYDPAFQKIYVTAYEPLPVRTGGNAVLYTLDLNGAVTSQKIGIPDGRGHIPTKAIPYGDKLIVLINHPFSEVATPKGPGYMVCDLNNVGNIGDCGSTRRFDGSKDLQVYNNKLYAIGPNGIYSFDGFAATPTPSQTVATCTGVNYTYTNASGVRTSGTSTSFLTTVDVPAQTTFTVDNLNTSEGQTTGRGAYVFNLSCLQGNSSAACNPAASGLKTLPYNGTIPNEVGSSYQVNGLVDSNFASSGSGTCAVRYRIIAPLDNPTTSPTASPTEIPTASPTDTVSPTDTASPTATASTSPTATITSSVTTSPTTTTTNPTSTGSTASPSATVSPTAQLPATGISAISEYMGIIVGTLLLMVGVVVALGRARSKSSIPF